jgi:hypothetical protein
MDGLSAQTVARDRNCLFQSLSLLLDDEGQHNRLRQKVVQYVYNNLEQFLPVFLLMGKNIWLI